MSEIPCSETYRHVGIHAGQSPDRAAIVRAEIDAVFELDDINALMAWLENIARSPESRVLAGTMIEAMHKLAVDERRERPAIDLGLVHAITAPLMSTAWMDAVYHCSVLEAPGDGGRMAVRREQHLNGGPLCG